ncbi:malto-oligosyltrehalose trehalohydrolase [Parafrigoribacterium mesophilum]|uniref:malto-oligosyltrehalose trehalohydrolase n=1 Tax=Parafrigoribacterium mesophilum TaxID=433646 RepID=UPI0031FBAB48
MNFDVWAPAARSVALLADGERRAMVAGPDGWWQPAEPVPGSVVDYGYLLDDDAVALPDPRSRRQPGGVHELSRTFDGSAFAWTDARWTGRQLAGGVIYELHIGTFTPEGTLDAATARLGHLVDLGIDFVELLPVNAFNGHHNWGYDGVLWYAVQESYGGPVAYQRFVDACHAAGLAVIQDVVYNHLGPSGNYLPRFGPYLNRSAKNTWGESINLDGADAAPVRRFILDNARMWLRDYHVDGLRLDAVHALVDHSAKHLLQELAEETEALSAFLGRPLSLIAESDLNDPTLITPREGDGYGLTAQWSDDFHHAVHVAVTGETVGYYSDFDSLAALSKVLTRGFFHDGTYSSFRGRPHGRPVDTERMPAFRLVVSDQTHDQVGNRAAGDRLAASVDDGALAIAAALTLTSPFTPMLFMGEEWAASTPWQFFTSHPEPELAAATVAGRLAEFERMGWDPAVVPDPGDLATFAGSKLDWAEVDGGRHRRMHDFYRRLIALRRSHPEFADPRFGSVATEFDENERWFVVHRGGLAVVANFDVSRHRIRLPGNRILLSWDEASHFDGEVLDMAARCVTITAAV